MVVNNKVVEVSKFFSYVLRHRPDSIGIQLDTQGWVDIATLLAAANRHGKRISPELLRTVVADNDKQRFAISEDGLRIRAVQGHSAKNIEMDYQAKLPPEVLYHGTATRFLDSIRQQGLLPGSRQYVHLSQDEQTALKVGQRHGKPVILKILALQMHQQGYPFFQADNGVWLTKQVPVLYIQE